MESKDICLAVMVNEFLKEEGIMITEGNLVIDKIKISEEIYDLLVDYSIWLEKKLGYCIYSKEGDSNADRN